MFQIDMAPFEKMAANVGAMQDQAYIQSVR